MGEYLGKNDRILERREYLTCTQEVVGSNPIRTEEMPRKICNNERDKLLIIFVFTGITKKYLEV